MTKRRPGGIEGRWAGVLCCPTQGAVNQGGDWEHGACRVLIGGVCKEVWYRWLWVGTSGRYGFRRGASIILYKVAPSLNVYIKFTLVVTCGTDEGIREICPGVR